MGLSTLGPDPFVTGASPQTWHSTRTAGPSRPRRRSTSPLAAARAASNPEVTPDHLLLALLGQEDGVVLPILQKVGVAPAAAAQRAPTRRSAKLPKAYGGESRVGRELTALLDRADEARARAARRVPLDRAPAAGPGRPRRRRAATTCSPPCPRCAAATASPARTPRSSTRPSRSTAATSPRTARAGQARPGHRPRRGDPPRHPGAVAAAPRTTRCSSASPASARPPSSRAWPGASSRATCPRA